MRRWWKKNLSNPCAPCRLPLYDVMADVFKVFFFSHKQEFIGVVYDENGKAPGGSRIWNFKSWICQLNLNLAIFYYYNATFAVLFNFPFLKEKKLPFLFWHAAWKWKSTRSEWIWKILLPSSPQLWNYSLHSFLFFFMSNFMI